MNLRRQRSSSQARSHRLLAIEQLLPQSEGRGRDIVGGGFGGPMLGHQFPPTQVAESLTLQHDVQQSLAAGKPLLSSDFSAQLLDSLVYLTLCFSCRLLALIEFGVADVQYPIVQSTRRVEEASLCLLYTSPSPRD